jgi:LysR family transcriptional regulator, hca operon transcriptional activator
MPADHPLAAKSAIRLDEIAGETFISVSGTALSISGKQPALRRTIDSYLKKQGIEIRPSHEVDNLGGVMSLIASMRGLALLPRYAKTFLPSSITTRPLDGGGPTIDLSVGYRRSNPSTVLKLFLSRIDELAAKPAEGTVS